MNRDDLRNTEASSDSEKPGQAPIPAAKAKASSTEQIETQEGLWRVCYENIGRNVLIKKSSLRNLKSSEAEIAGVTKLIESNQSLDTKFKVPLKILQAVLGANLERTIQDRVCHCVTFALTKFANLEEAIEWPLTGDVASLSVIGRQAKANVVDANELTDFRENVLKCFALLMVAGGKWDIDRYIFELTSSIWTVKSKPQNKSIEAAILSESTQHQQLAILGKKLRVKEQEHQREYSMAQKQASNALRDVGLVEEKLIQLGDQLSELTIANSDAKKEIDALKLALNIERQNASIDRTHLADDFESLRGEVSRRLSSQSELLKDGIQALKAGHHAIAEEYVDRALRAINGEVARLGESEMGQ